MTSTMSLISWCYYGPHPWIDIYTQHMCNCSHILFLMHSQGWLANEGGWSSQWRWWIGEGHWGTLHAHLLLLLGTSALYLLPKNPLVFPLISTEEFLESRKRKMEMRGGRMVACNISWEHLGGGHKKVHAHEWKGMWWCSLATLKVGDRFRSAQFLIPP